MIRILFPILLLLASVSNAKQPFEFSGFGTLGVVTTDSEHYGFRNSLAQTDGAFKDDIDFESTSVLGAQLDVSLHEQLDFSYQAVYRDQNNFSLDSASSLAFLRYSPTPQWSFRVGRTALDVFRLSEYRDIGFAYVWAIAPTEVYGLVPYRHLDGGDVTFSQPFDAATLRAKLFAGRSSSDLSSYRFDPELELDDAYGLSLSLEALDWNIEARYATVKAAGILDGQDALIAGIQELGEIPNVWPNANLFARQLDYNNAEVRYASIGGNYFYRDWQFSTELSRTSSDSIILRNQHAGFFSVIKRFNNHAFHATFALTDAKPYDTSVQETDTSFLPAMVRDAVQEQVQAALNGSDLSLHYYASSQRTFSVGWRWDIREYLALKVQLNRTYIESKGGNLWLSDISGVPSAEEAFPKETVNTLLTNLSFIF